MTGDPPIGEDDLQAYVDGRLSPGRVGRVEAYLAENPDAAVRAAADLDQREALRERLAFRAREPIPARLRIAHIVEAKRRRPILRPVAVAAAMAWLAVGLALGAAGGAWWAGDRAPQAQQAQVAAEAIAAHRIYVGEKLHPVEVAADQEAHLVQWLSRRLGRPLSTPDLTGQGYRLIGGRLLPSGSNPAALFMYEDAQGGRLTLYARSGGAGEQTAFRFEAREGVSAFSWIDNGLSYVVTARADRAQLLSIVEAIDRQFEAAPAAQRSPL